MPLSDLFKKPSKKEPAASPQPAKDQSLVSPEMQKKRYEAAMAFMEYYQNRVPFVGGRPHAGTILAAVARLAGSSLYRSLNAARDIAPGVVVLSDQVNEAWPQLLNQFAYYCMKQGLDVSSKPPVTNFPEQDKPRMTVEQVLAEYQDQYHEIMQKHGLDYLNGARAGMIVCSVVFEHHCKTVKDIDPSVAAGIVAMGIVEGAKTAPPPFGSGGKMKVESEKKGTNNNRLLLGEREAVLQESRSNGGIYIDPNPGVLQALQTKNIDPYLIYEQVLRNEIEKKVPRIDFIKSDVEALFQEWQGKPESQTPIHVRLIRWLKENAGTHGYEQRGNSWLLK